MDKSESTKPTSFWFTEEGLKGKQLLRELFEADLTESIFGSASHTYTKTNHGINKKNAVGSN